MSTILFTWEQGGGLGHMIPLVPVAGALARAGHRVFMALRDISRARAIFTDENIQILQAPVKLEGPREPILPSMTFAHILHNIGFGEAVELGAAVDAWGHIYRYVQPDLILFEHSPTALLAARGTQARKALIGQGFFSPPDVSPLPNLCAWLAHDSRESHADEMRILGVMNSVLAKRGCGPLERITQMYREVDENFLTILKELDHYPQRSNPRYWGHWHQHEGNRPAWPNVAGKRIYAYLKLYPQLPQLLETLIRVGQPTVIFIDALATQFKESFRAPNICFEQRRLDISAAAAECDVAILNGTISTTTSMLLAGKPTLQLPIYLEQALFTRMVCRLGAAEEAALEDAAQVSNGLERLLGSERYSAAAREFAARYAGYDQDQNIARLVSRIGELVS